MPIPYSTAKGFAVPLNVIPGQLDIQKEGIRFRLSDGETTVSCSVSRFVLQDLISHHLPGVNVTDLQAFVELLPGIAHLANVKYDAGRIDENGEIVIGTADLLRHGLQSPAAHLASMAIIRRAANLPEDVIYRRESSSRDVLGTTEPQVRVTLVAVDKNRPRRKPAAALFREGLHLRTPLFPGSKLARPDRDPPIGEVVELNRMRSLMRGDEPDTMERGWR
jgi:hypothetical protein